MSQPFDRYLELAIALLTASGAGAIGAEIVRRLKSREERRAITAASGKTDAEADALLIDSMAGSLAAVTGSLRQEIERLQGEASSVRAQAQTLETDLRLALARVSELERALTAAEARIEELIADLERVRGERNVAQERIIQQEGQIRQMQAIVDAAKRVTET